MAGKRQRTPRTIGELRRELHKKGDPWTPNPYLRDEEPLPMPARGGLEPGEGPPEAEGPEPFEGDLEELLRADPPANPFVRERWTEQELLTADDPGPGPGSPGELTEEAEGGEAG
jgi:hypothetical protein